MFPVELYRYYKEEKYYYSLDLKCTPNAHSLLKAIPLTGAVKWWNFKSQDLMKDLAIIGTVSLKGIVVVGP